jgi:hypothetical protein
MPGRALASLLTHWAILGTVSELLYPVVRTRGVEPEMLARFDADASFV